MIVRQSQGGCAGADWRLIRHANGSNVRSARVVHPLELRTFVFGNQEVNFHLRVRRRHVNGFLVLDEEDRGDAVQHQRQAEVQHFDEFVKFVLHRQILHFRLGAVELDVREAPGAQDVIVGAGVEGEIERRVAFEIIFAVFKLKKYF